MKYSMLKINTNNNVIVIIVPNRNCNQCKRSWDYILVGTNVYTIAFCLLLNIFCPFSLHFWVTYLLEVCQLLLLYCILLCCPCVCSFVFRLQYNQYCVHIISVFTFTLLFLAVSASHVMVQIHTQRFNHKNIT